mgnify:CR=1 FL=1
MIRRKKTLRTSKYESEAAIVNVTVSKIDYQNLNVGGKLKTVFYCPSCYVPEGRMSVVWGETNFSVGDELVMKGRYKDGVFLVWSYQIHKRAAQSEQQQKTKNGS